MDHRLALAVSGALHVPAEMLAAYDARPANHPAKLEWLGYDEETDEPIEDYVDYLNRQADEWCNNPPPAPPGFELIECDAEPRHWPMYSVVDDDFYGGPPCLYCTSAVLREQHAPCEHSHHRAWRRWKITRRILGHLYTWRLVRSYGTTYNGHCRGCTTIRWGIRRG
jgi:hypothetical protein